MKIRTKSIIAIVAITLAIFLVLHSVSVFVIAPSFESIDRRENQQSISQIMATLQYRIEQIETNVQDYSFWNDTYQFVLDNNQNFITDNFVESTFANLRISLLAIFDNSNLLYCQSFDLATSSMTSTSQSTMQLLSNELSEAHNSTLVGFLQIDNQPLMIAVSPILTTEGNGPTVGKMLFGTPLDDVEISALKEITNRNLTIDSVNIFETENQAIVTALLSNPQATKQKISNNAITGYLLIDDVNFNPALILQVTTQREAYQQGLWVEYSFLISAIALSITLGAAILGLLETSVVKPLKKMSASIKTMPFVSDKKDTPKFGTDEIDVVNRAVADAIETKFDAMKDVSRMVAHDLRNPLSGIKGAAYVLRKNFGEELDEKGKTMLKTIDECVAYSDKIVQDLLDYSAAVRLEKKKTELNKLVNDCLSNVAATNKVKVINQIAEGTFVLVDRIRIGRVFTNLIKNAYDAMPDGGKLEVSCEMEKKYLIVRFSDTGSGMTDDVLKQLWTPFFTTKEKGMGIGLSICKRIVEAHDGKIEAKSTVGKGTTFEIFLPIEKLAPN